MKDRLGFRNGRLVVTSFRRRYRGVPVWNCTCHCGNEIAVSARDLHRIMSCGCLKRELASQLRKKYAPQINLALEARKVPLRTRFFSHVEQGELPAPESSVA